MRFFLGLLLLFSASSARAQSSGAEDARLAMLRAHVAQIGQIAQVGHIGQPVASLGGVALRPGAQAAESGHSLRVGAGSTAGWLSGAVGGAVVGLGIGMLIPRGNDYFSSGYALEGAAIGALLAPAAGAALGAHLANRRDGSLGRTMGAAYAPVVIGVAIGAPAALVGNENVSALAIGGGLLLSIVVAARAELTQAH